MALPRPESIALLRRLVPNLVEADAGAIAAALGDLPLALHLAGHFLAYHGAAISPQAYLDHLRHTASPAQPSPPDHELDLGRVIALSYEGLEIAVEADVSARYLLACAASLAPGEPIPRDLLLAVSPQPQPTRWTRLRHRLRLNRSLFTTGVDLRPARAALDRLLQLGFLSPASNQTLLLHGRVAEFVLGQAEVAGAQAAVEQALMTALSGRVEHAGYLGPLPTLAAHLRHVTDRARPRRDTTAASLCNQLGYYLHERGDYPAARNYLQEALAIRRRLLGPEHPATATTLNNLGLLLQDMGNHDDAREYLEQALAVFRQVLGRHHPQIPISLNNLGFLLRAMGNYPAARNYLEQALAIQRRLLGQQHLEVAQTLNNLGRLLHDMGDYPAARNDLQQALAIYQQRLGRHHPDTATVLNNLGALLQDVGDLPAAQAHYEQALAIRRKRLGQHHPATIASLNNLSRLLYARDSVSNKSGL